MLWCEDIVHHVAEQKILSNPQRYKAVEPGMITISSSFACDVYSVPSSDAQVMFI